MSISTLAVRTRTRARFNTRAEFRRALLAAGETCWVYAFILTFSAIVGLTRLASPFALFVTYWLALEIGHYLPRLHHPWRLLQVLNVALAAIILLAIVRLDLYREFPPLDFTWLSIYAGQLAGIFSRLTPEQITTLALLYVYVRGVGFGQRPLTLWFAGFQFRLGVIVFFLTALLGVLARGVNLAPLLVVYFVVSLLSITLARIEESGREMALGARWAILLASAILLAVALGSLITPLFTLAAANALFELLSPLAPVFEFLLVLILTPLFWIIGALLRLLAPLFQALAQAFQHWQLNLSPELVDAIKRLTPTLPDLTFLFPYVRLLALLALVLGVALFVARALNRRIMQLEEETFIRESAGALDSNPAEKMPRPRPSPMAPHEMEAENIRRIYAALLARAAALGLPRREAETPLEFLPRLTAEYPAAGRDLSALTEAYVAVHYAQRPATSVQVQEMRAVWQRLRRELVRKK